MSPRAALEDRVAFQRVRRALAEVLKEVGETYGNPHKATVAALAKAHRAAERAVYPDCTEAELATLRQWMRLIESYVTTSLDMERRLHIGALSTLQMDVALVLGPFADPSALPTPEAQGRPAWWTD